jgi:hypothetical protein
MAGGDGEEMKVHVILSEAKDLMPIASGDEVLRLRSGRQSLCRDDES